MPCSHGFVHARRSRQLCCQFVHCLCRSVVLVYIHFHSSLSTAHRSKVPPLDLQQPSLLQAYTPAPCRSSKPNISASGKTRSPTARMAAPLPFQQTPLIFHPSPYRPYNPVLESAWNDADQHCAQVQLPTTGAANAYTANRTSPQLPDKSEAIQERSPISTPPISVKKQNIACPQSQALPFLTNWRSMAGISTLPKHHPGLQMTRASKVSY